MKARKLFIYLAIIAVVLGIIGVIRISGNLSGNVVLKTEILNKYSLTEIKSHNSLGDCWIISNNLVYDVAMILSINKNFESLKEKCGQDASEIVKGFSQDARNVLENYKVGILG